MDEFGIWVLSTGRGANQAAAWVANSTCATNYWEAGFIAPGADPEDVRAAMGRAYKKDPSTCGTRAGQLLRFLSPDRIGDWVVIADDTSAYIGEITGEATFDETEGAVFPRRRAVDWQITVPRKSLPRYSTQAAGGTFQQLLADNREPVEALINAHQNEKRRLVGVPYRKARTDSTVAPSMPVAPDPALIERARNTHARLQNALADAAEVRGFVPRSPAPEEPDYDLVLTGLDGERLILCEVKSLPEGADTAQLRSAVGQLLEYADHFRDHDGLRLLLWVEREPADVEAWLRICSRADITLGWPGMEDAILTLP